MNDVNRMVYCNRNKRNGLFIRFYVPKAKHRLAFISLITFEATTWASINILVQSNQISFPVREFAKATQVGFLQNFLFYPMIFAWFMILYPAGPSKLKKSCIISSLYPLSFGLFTLSAYILIWKISSVTQSIPNLFVYI